MSDATSSPSTSTTDTGAPPPQSGAAGGAPTALWTWVERRLLVVAILTVLATIGLFWTGYRPQQALWYWSAMFPAFGAISVWQELAGGRNRDSVGRVLLLQAAHWLGPVIAVRILFLSLSRGQVSGDAAGMMTLLLLAVTCFLAGVHFTPSFLWVSVLLALGVVLGTAIQTYLWVLVVLALGAVAAVAWSLMRRRPSA
jgi:hypothetical protein